MTIEPWPLGYHTWVSPDGRTVERIPSRTLRDSLAMRTQIVQQWTATIRSIWADDPVALAIIGQMNERLEPRIADRLQAGGDRP